MPTDLFQQIKQQIIKNKLKEACNLLMETTVSKESIDLMARVEKLDNLIITNQISNEEASREESRIRQALLTLVEKLETGSVHPTVPKKRLPWVIGGVVILLLVPLGIWMSQKTGKVSCEEIKKPYTIVVADFMREEPAFAQRVVAHLQDNFSTQPDLVGISPMGRFLDPLKAREDTFSQVITRHCVEKGLILYGTLSKIDDEKLFNGYIKLEGLKNASLAAEKTSVDRVIFTSESNIKVPDEINFSIAEQAQLVSDFTTGLLKYYLGDTTAIAYFQKTIQKLKPASEEKLKDVANLYLGNTYLAAGKAEKALKIYDEIGEISPIKAEITWNQSLAHIQLKQFDQATRKIVQYVQVQNQPLQVQDTLVILKMKQEMEEALTETEVEAILAPVIAAIPKMALKLKTEKEPEAEKSTETTQHASTDNQKPGQREPEKNSEDKTRDDKTSLNNTTSQPQEAENQSAINNDQPETKTEPVKTNPERSTDQLPLPEMIKITGGTFWMGADNEESDEKPRHQVTVQSFYLSETEVTNAQYAAFLNQVRPNSSDLEKWINLQRKTSLEKCRITLINDKYEVESHYENHPVIYVSWYGAVAYCQEMGYRLPTEAEWEYAAGGGNTNNRTRWAGTDDENALSNFGVFNSSSGTARVKSKRANQLGLYDMSGNVWEWCQDGYDKDYYQACQEKGLVENPKGPENGIFRVIRGGSWSFNALLLRVSSRYSNRPARQNSYYGFRVARTR